MIEGGKADGVYEKKEDLKVGGRRGESEQRMKAKGHDVPAPSGVFELLLRAYHGNNCLDCSHLRSRLQGLMITKAGRWRRIEKVREKGAVVREGGWWWLQMMPQLVWRCGQTVPYGDSNKPNRLLVALLAKMDD